MAKIAEYPIWDESVNSSEPFDAHLNQRMLQNLVAIYKDRLPTMLVAMPPKTGSHHSWYVSGASYSNVFQFPWRFKARTTKIGIACHIVNNNAVTPSSSSARLKVTLAHNVGMTIDEEIPAADGDWTSGFYNSTSEELDLEEAKGNSANEPVEGTVKIALIDGCEVYSLTLYEKSE